MTPETGLLGFLALVGQTTAIIFLVNVVHGVGGKERILDAFKLAMLLVLGVLTLAVGWLVGSGDASTWPAPIAGYLIACAILGGIGLPLVSLARFLRRGPDGIAEHSREIDLTDTETASSLIGEGRYARLLRLPGNESLRLRKREWDVVLPTLPSRLDGLCVVQLTDLHFAPCFRRRFFERIVEEAASWDADLVVFTGDLIDHDDALEWVVPVLSRIRGRLGTYSILGNHDMAHDPRRITGALEDAGFNDLEGRWCRLPIAGADLAIGGTSAPWGPTLPLEAESDADFRILLSHSPDQFPNAVAAGIDLMLSGHNHGGQIRIPGLGPIFMPSVYSRRFDRGFFRSGKTLLHVSQGVAGKHPIRFGCVPEVGRFVLRCARPSSPHFPDNEPRRKTESSLLVH